MVYRSAQRLLQPNLFCRVLLFAAMLIPVASSRGAENSMLSWVSPKVLEVKKDFESLRASFTEPSTQSNYGERATKISDLLRKRLSHQEMSELAATCDKLPVSEKDWSGFERCLILEMASVFLKEGDRDSLVALFSTRFPSRYHFMDIEDLVVRHGTKLKDPVLILGDAYSKCQVPEVRLQIAQAIRRGFKGSGIRGNDDADFVKNAMQWYEREKDQLVFNPAYCYNRSQGDGYIKRPLFVRKPSAADNQPKESEKDKMIPQAATVQAKPLKTATNSIGVKMVLIPAGDFVMGSPENEKGHKKSEGPQHLVRITRPFWLGVYEVTQAEYESVIGKNPSLFSPKGGLAVSGLDTRRFPVEYVSWYDAVEFCNWLSKKEGLPECYRLPEAKPKDLWKTVKVIGGQGYRLPNSRGLN